MTPIALLRIGDNVIFNVTPRHRSQTNDYHGLPDDGTKGVVLDFKYRVTYNPRVPVWVDQPGVYHTRSAIEVLLKDGRRFVLDADLIDMVDQKEKRRRDEASRGADGAICISPIRLHDLPETKFWEQDKVLVRLPDGRKENMTVARINFSDIHLRRPDGSPYPLYDVNRIVDGNSIGVDESQMELVERGNVWKLYHNEPLLFSSLKDEAIFSELIGHTDEVRNPNNGLCLWTKDEVLKAIKDGDVHGYSISCRFFEPGSMVRAVRYHDTKLGKRIALATVRDFDMASA
ncbi:hypothetical protein KBD87_01275 [Candidatus Saccharibacteria bacterium]|nr:hypothetical protein [Candidatus Saccharibacteria bacterium]